jgi:hypothetical protein
LPQPSHKLKRINKLLKTTDEKEIFSISKIRNTPLKEKGSNQKHPMKKRLHYLKNEKHNPRK